MNSRENGLQFDTVPLEMKRAGRRANATPDPETRTAVKEPVTMSFVGLIPDSVPPRNENVTRTLRGAA